MTSYKVEWCSFWYQWIEEVHTYTLVANIGGSSVPYRKPGRELQKSPPPQLRRMCYRKYIWRTRVNFWSLHNKIAYLEFSVAFSCSHCKFHQQNNPIPASCWPLVVTSELGHRHLVTCIGPVFVESLLVYEDVVSPHCPLLIWAVWGILYCRDRALSEGQVFRT